MRPITFPQVTDQVAKDQPEYITLPAYYGQLGEHPGQTGLVTCFELTPEEIDNVVKFGKIWHTQLTFGHAMQPIMLVAANDFFNLESDKEPATTKLDLRNLESIRFEWSKKTFPGATTQSALEHLKDEIKEIEADPSDVVEYADALMLLMEAAARNQITVDQILVAFQEKHQKNTTRKWVQNGNGSYYHIKEV